MGTVSFTIVSKNLEITSVNQMKELYNKTFKTFKTEIEEDSRRWKG